MPLSTREQQILDRINEATNKIAAKLRDLIANPPDDAEFDTQLEAMATSLEAIGTTDPTA